MPIQNVNPIGSRDPCLYTLPLSLLPDRSKRDRIVVALEKKKNNDRKKKDIPGDCSAWNVAALFVHTLHFFGSIQILS